MRGCSLRGGCRPVALKAAGMTLLHIAARAASDLASPRSDGKACAAGASTVGGAEADVYFHVRGDRLLSTLSLPVGSRAVGGGWRTAARREIAPCLAHVRGERARHSTYVREGGAPVVNRAPVRGGRGGQDAGSALRPAGGGIVCGRRPNLQKHAEGGPDGKPAHGHQ